MSPDLAGVVLAAGEGRRLRPLSALRPKALCPVGNLPLLERALQRLGPCCGTGPDRLAVNAHHLAEQILDYCTGRVHVSREEPQALGTAGALGALRGWLDGRDVLVTNADAYLPAGLARLVAGWDGRRCRLLCSPGGPADFAGPDGAPLQYVGACLLPWRSVRLLAAEPSGLYEALWRGSAELDLVVTADTAIDCGRPPGYLAANLHASGGAPVVGAGATVLGRLTRSVVWDGAWVGPGEHLVDAVRAGSRAHPITVFAASPAP